jgi:hypothetical protein
MNSRASSAKVAMPHNLGGQLEMMTIGFIVYYLLAVFVLN